MTSCKLSGVMAHPGYPGTGENGGERSNTYQYAAAAAHNPAISNALLLSEEDVVISPFALPSSLLSLSFFLLFSFFCFSAKICSFTSGATTRMIENDASPSFIGDSTTSLA